VLRCGVSGALGQPPPPAACGIAALLAADDLDGDFRSNAVPIWRETALIGACASFTMFSRATWLVTASVSSSKRRIAMQRLGTINVLGTLLALGNVLGYAQDVRSVVRITPDGQTTVETQGPGDPAAGNGAWDGYEQGRRASGVIWHNTLVDAIYNNTAIPLPAGRMCSGTYLNPPKEFELLPLEGDGTPDWTYSGSDFQVAASRDAEVLAATDYNSSMQKATVYCWHPASATPDWSYTISPCTRATYRGIAVSPDGAIIAVLVTMQASPTYTRLYYFSPSSSTPLGTYDPASASFARTLDISADGQYVALYAQARVCVFDTTAGVQRYSGDAGATAEGLALSGDGQYLAYGWSSLFVRQWNGSTYSPLWSKPGSGFYLSRCAIATDGSTLVAAWYRSDFRQNKVELYDLPSSTPLWTYLSTVSSGVKQEMPADLALLADGSYCALASWGDANNLNPEVNVFRHADATPVLTLDTPGSMFDVDVAAGPSGPVYISACGKHIHANDSGRGGDLYSLRLDRYATGDMNCDGTIDFGDINPFVLYLADFAAWQTAYAGCPLDIGDVNGDGLYPDFGDINPFVALLVGLP
jgi:WD40 repeat protein